MDAARVRDSCPGHRALAGDRRRIERGIQRLDIPARVGERDVAQLARGRTALATSATSARSALELVLHLRRRWSRRSAGGHHGSTSCLVSRSAAPHYARAARPPRRMVSCLPIPTPPAGASSQAAVPDRARAGAASSGARRPPPVPAAARVGGRSAVPSMKDTRNAGRARVTQVGRSPCRSSRSPSHTGGVQCPAPSSPACRRALSHRARARARWASSTPAEPRPDCAEGGAAARARSLSINWISVRSRSAPGRSALLTTKTSAISMSPALSVWIESPDSGTSTTTQVSTVRATSSSLCPTPTVSTISGQNRTRRARPRLRGSPRTGRPAHHEWPASG